MRAAAAGDDVGALLAGLRLGTLFALLERVYLDLRPAGAERRPAAGPEPGEV